MELNRDNYEAYFLDFLEGNLTPEQEEMLNRFLKFNPDLEEELHSFSFLSISPENTNYPEKASLKKEIPPTAESLSPGNFDIFCIAYLEGDLSEAQKEALFNFLEENPSYAEILDTYRLTHLVPENIAFPGKGKIHKRKVSGFQWRILVPLAAAAAIALMLIFKPSLAPESVEIASVEVPEKKPEKVKETIQPYKANNQLPATLNVIRTKSSPVPQSDYRKNDQNQDLNEKDKNNTSSPKPQRMADLDLGQRLIQPVPYENEMIYPEAVPPPAINKSSLSLAELARYQFRRASNAMEEEDVLLWNLASSGIKELNRLTGSEAQLLASRNEEGSISGFQFRSKYLNVTAPIAREE